ncbi:MULTISPECIES: hypothetical protein [Sphingobacterium]|jgi:hypothetical protein|uniref:hypothetical protein n=2 Tax=Sphingobacterium TaxID=28453 RepID=UPI000A9A158F|nr:MULTISPECIES: hypothetical protein [Sphingobacterium]
MEEHFETLMGKLRQLYTQGKEIGLSLEEAVIYGTDYADEWPMEEFDKSSQQEDQDGQP